MEKAGYITVRNPAVPAANFTATPSTGPTPLSVMFNDTSTNTPSGWLWIFGDGTNATMQNLVHIYSEPGNYTVSLNVTNDDGENSLTKPEFIKVTSPPPTTVTTIPTTVTTIITVPPTTARPTPTKTHAPLSLIPVGTAFILIGVFTIWRDRGK